MSRARKPAADTLPLPRAIVEGLLDAGREMQAAEASAAQRQAERQADDARKLEVSEKLDADRVALARVGLEPLPADDASHVQIGESWGEHAVFINTRAHPATIVSTALARAMRCHAVAELLEEKDSSPAAFALVCMAREVVDILELAARHDSIVHASWPWPRTNAA